MTKLIRNFFVLLVLTQIFGCAMFRGGELEDISKQWPPKKEQTHSISVVVTGKAEFNGKPVDASPAMVNKWQDSVISTYKESGLFSDVSKGMASTDLRAEVSIKDQGKGSMAAAFLTGLTLYIIPSRAEDTFTVQTTFKNAEGKVLGTVEKRESVILWQQLFLIFGGPFTLSSNGATAVLSDIVKASLLEAQEKNIL